MPWMAMPEIGVRLDASGNIEAGYDTRALLKWFFAFCEEKSYHIYNQAARDLGDEVQDDARLRST